MPCDERAANRGPTVRVTGVIGNIRARRPFEPRLIENRYLPDSTTAHAEPADTSADTPVAQAPLALEDTHIEAAETHAPEPEAAPEAAVRHAPPHGAAQEDATADEPEEHAAEDAEAAPPAVEEPPEPTFADLGLSPPVLEAIAEMGYRIPTPIQQQAIPFVLMGRDVLGTAQTGTGKTASFVLPMLDILEGSRARARMPRSLILEPTRELALQVAENFLKYGKHLKLTHALIIGGESMSDQKEILNRGVDVLIATPGRLIDMFERGGILLSDAKLLVIDEADRMLDMGFIPDVERIVGMLPKTRQTLFFSATMAPEIKRLADAFLDNPKLIAVSRPASVAATIVSGLVLVAEQDKREALRRLVREQNVQNALIFCNRKRDVDILHKSLSNHKFSVGALHGDMAQSVRFSTLERFKAGEIRLLVCSDVAARGIDIGGLSHVFNFDVPIHSEDYIHRIGRTGRAGLTGHAFTIATAEDQYAVNQIEKLIGMPIPLVRIEGLDEVHWSDGPAKPKGRGRRAPAKPASRAPAAPKPESPKPESPKPDAPKADAAPKRASRGRGRSKPPAESPPLDSPQPEIAYDPPPAPVFAAPAFAAPASARPVQADRTERDSRPTTPRGEDRGPRREGRYRPDDLGPAVRGFGGEVPAFMLVAVRSSRPHGQSDATGYDAADDVPDLAEQMESAE